MSDAYDTLFKEVIGKIKEYNPKADFNIIEKAYHFAKEAHKDQKRISGELYIIHPLEVTNILTTLKADTSTICAGLLHDTLEDTKSTEQDLLNKFGEDVTNLVKSLTKIEKIKFLSTEDYTAENLRKILFATTKDIRVIFIKLADRLHNMRTLKFFREEKQKRISQETIEIYAPIASKLGLYNLKGELEDLSFRFLHPEEYEELKNHISLKREERVEITKEIIKEVKELLKEHEIKAEIQGRAKFFYSIYKKMKRDKKDFNEIYDLIAIRIIVPSIDECYKVLGIIHNIWRPLPHRFKDYISLPKPNGYRSIHTTVAGSHNKILEIQIRSEEIHQQAEEGTAAHWRYKGTERDKQFDQRISWIKQLIEWRRENEKATDFIENLKFDLFQSEIVTFTPKGDPITLAEGATPIDFAYAVHSNIGQKCKSALVNKKVVPLDQELRSGDIVEIITGNDAEPSRQWLHSVKTSKARSRIKNYLNLSKHRIIKKSKEEVQVNYIDELDIKDKKIKKANIKLSKCCNPTPEDDIIALLTKDKKITIHTKACPNSHAIINQKTVDIDWKKKEEEKINLHVTTENRVGILSDILKIFSEFGINLQSINTKPKKNKILIQMEFEEPKRISIKELTSRIKTIEDTEDIKIIESE